MTTPNPVRRPGRWLRALRVWTPLGFFSLIAILVWLTSMAGLQQRGARGLLAFLAGFSWMAVVTVLAYRLLLRGIPAPPPPSRRGEERGCDGG
jgi:hypothetical protein